MIKESEITINGHRTNIDHYRKLGYVIEYRKPCSVKVVDLLPGSLVKITSICDSCEVEKSNFFRDYYEYTGGLKVKYFCNKCNSEKRKQTCLQKWGTENPMQSLEVQEKLKSSLQETYGVDHYSKTDEFKEKIKYTNRINWGVDNVFQSEMIKEKIKETNLKNLGVEYPQQSESIKEKTKANNYEKWNVTSFSKTEDFVNKIKEISLAKWGVDNYSKTQEFKIKTKETSLKKWGIDSFAKTDEFKDKIRNSKENLTKLRYENLIGSDYSILEYKKTIFTIQHSTCGKNFTINRDNLYSRHNLDLGLCTICYPISIQESCIEIQLREFLDTLDVTYVIKDRTILEGKELDIFLPEYNLAIEMNGLYWHSEIYLDKNYHLNKTLACKSKGIELLHIWEDDWKSKKEIICSIIRNRISKISKKIFARKCEIKDVDASIAANFLDENHIQGSSPSQIKYGLYFSGELVSLMTFGFRWTNKKREFELIRFCNKVNHNIIGSASKLFKHFIEKNEVERIVSYSDISLFTGNLYEVLGFKKELKSKPNYFWVVDGVRRHRFNFNKKRLEKLGYDVNKSEAEIMHELGHYRVYSCGQERWVFTR